MKKKCSVSCLVLLVLIISIGRLEATASADGDRGDTTGIPRRDARVVQVTQV